MRCSTPASASKPTPRRCVAESYSPRNAPSHQTPNIVATHRTRRRPKPSPRSPTSRRPPPRGSTPTTRTTTWASDARRFRAARRGAWTRTSPGARRPSRNNQIVFDRSRRRRRSRRHSRARKRPCARARPRWRAVSTSARPRRSGTCARPSRTAHSTPRATPPERI